MTEKPPLRSPNRLRVATVRVFVVAALVAGATVAGPGLSWDEPAYRHSQVTLQSWIREIVGAPTAAERAQLFSRDAIAVFWEFNRVGHNFHPPMASYLNLTTFAIFGGWIDDIAARRMASALEFAGLVTLLCHTVGRRLGIAAGLFAAATLLFMPRVMGDAHVIGTDMPLAFFWAATTLAFERGFLSTRWQVACAGLFACLFLVKFSGVVIVAPLALWWVATVFFRASWRPQLQWLLHTLVMTAPLLPYGAIFLRGVGVQRVDGVIRAVQCLGLETPWVFWMCLVWPGLYLLFVARSGVGAVVEERSPARVRFGSRLNGAEINVAWTLPWMVLAVTPAVCLILNPTWWHDPVLALARYFDLNLRREGFLPTIGIFYLGQRYFYSLPWHNAFVLMAVTIPFGALFFGLVGCGRALVQRGWMLFWFLSALALPLFRMLPTPAHDGVRLFLPTFFFWAGLAAAGVTWLAAGRKWVWLVAWFVGPGWAAVDWVRVHPYELSYYNIGLKRAFDAGFEATYWYDAVTPQVLDQLNEKLPPNAAATVFTDELINPEVFTALKHLGKLRTDLVVDPPPDRADPWVLLLTHSSKATAYTRFLYACKPWYESGHDGVRLFSVIDTPSVNLAWALRTLTVESESSKRLGSLKIHERILRFLLPISDGRSS